MIPPRLPQAGPLAQDPSQINPPLGGMLEPSPEMPPSFSAPIQPLDPPVLPWPEKPSEEFQEEAFKWFGPALKAARSHVLKDIDQHELAMKLYRNAVKLSELETQGKELPQQMRQDSTFRPKKPDWCSDYVYPIAPGIRQYATVGYRQIFSGPDWLVVFNRAPDSDRDANGYDAAQRMQKLLLYLLDQGGIYRTVFRSLLHHKLLPAIYAKTRWEHRSVRKRRFNLETQKWEHYEEDIANHPVVDLVPLDQILPDPKATTDNIDEWDFIGDLDRITTDELEALYTEGHYNLNYDEAKEKFIDKAGTAEPPPSSQLRQENLPTGGQVVAGVMSSPVDETDERRWVRRWEAHGLVPSKSMGGRVECCITIITDASSDSPEDGLVARLTTEPVLRSGRRPYASAQWTPLDGGPLGVSHPVELKETLFQQSQLTAMVIDIAKAVAVPRMKVVNSTRGAREINEDYAQNPGAFIPVDNADDITPLVPAQVPLEALLTALKYLDQQRQAQDVTSMYMGLASSGGGTATEATLQQQQSATPSDATLDLYSRDFLQRLCDLTVDLIQTKLTTDQTVPIQSGGNARSYLVVTAQDIQQGEYAVKITLTAQNASKIALAQTLRNLIADSINALPILQSQNSQLMLAELYKRLFDCVGLDGTDRIITPYEPPPPPSMTGQEMPSDQMNPWLAGQQGPSNGGPPDLLQNGGPMGPSQDDINAMAQFYQFMAPGSQEGM